jgi:integrase
MQQLVTLGRRRFAKRFPGQNFDASVWDISGLMDRSHWRERTNLYFTRHQTTDQPLPDSYAAAVKSWIILESRSVTNMKQRATAARCLWEVLLQRYGTAPHAFQWHQLCTEDLAQTELMMVERWQLSSTRETIRFVIALTKFLAARGLCRRLYFTPQMPSREDIRDYTLEGQESSRGKLPSPQAIEGLADIYRLAHEPKDQLKISIVALLLATGLRIGEVLTLPLDCEVEAVRAGKVTYGLRYYREKVRHAENRYDIRYLSPKQAELARHAIQRLRLLTADVRVQARVLEQQPNRVAIPGFTGNDRLTAAVIAEACGFKEGKNGRGYVDKLAKAGHFCRYVNEAGDFYYVAAEIEAYLRSERVERLWTLDRKDGTYQLLSESLLIIFKNFFHTEKATNPLLVEPVGHAHIASFISGTKSTRSVFKRFEIRETDGSFCQVTAHQFRRWCATLAHEGGAPIEVITQWLGHEHEETTRNHYIHTSMSQRAMLAVRALQEGQAEGSLVKMYNQLKEPQKQALTESLKSPTQAMHVGPWGLCVRNFVLGSDCDLNCLGNCPDYLRIKGDPQQVENLRQLERNLEAALAQVKTVAEQYGGQVAAPQLRLYEQQLANVKVALAIEDDPQLQSGEGRRPFEDAEHTNG